MLTEAVDENLSNSCATEPNKIPDTEKDDVINLDAKEDESKSEKKSNSANESVDLTVVDENSVVELDCEKSKGEETSVKTGDKCKKKQQVEEKFEIKKLYFADVKELDVFLLQATNSGDWLFNDHRHYFHNCVT